MVGKLVRACTTRNERKRVQYRDNLFETKQANRFDVPGRRKECTRLIVDGESVVDREELLQVGGKHFEKLVKSRVE